MSDVVAVGLSTDRLAAEMALVARVRLEKALGVHCQSIGCKIYLSGNKISPEFTVPADKVTGLTTEQITEVIKSVWWSTKSELERRLEDLGTYRG